MPKWLLVCLTATVLSALSACGGQSLTSESAQTKLKQAGLATSCSDQDSAIGSGSVKLTVCTTSGGSTYGLMIASGSDYDYIVQKVCSSGNAALLGSPVVTDQASFLAIGDSNFSFPADASASAIQKAVGGDIETWGVLCG